MSHNTAGYLFTNDPEVNVLVSELLLISSIFQILDSYNTVSRGIFEGIGKQNYTLSIYMILYIIGAPLGTLLSFQMDLKLPGLLIGMIISEFLCCVVTTWTILFVNWEMICIDINEKVGCGYLLFDAYRGLPSTDSEADDCDSDSEYY
jgi:Na+-driven multidrug efflux pump